MGVILQFDFEEATRNMDVEKYRQKLVAKEKELLRLLDRSVREQPSPGGLDSADVSVYSQQKEFLFAQADSNTQLLIQVRGALKRIAEGTYGECLEDGEPIPTVRLDALPWAQYCVKHQEMIDNLSPTVAA